jgi:hypothetical protein
MHQRLGSFDPASNKFWPLLSLLPFRFRQGCCGPPGVATLYFHATTACATLRHNGIEVGKRDFIGKY